MENSTAGTKQPARSNDEQGTQAVQRALRVLGCIRADRPRVSLSEFADEVGLTAPTTHRIVKTLQARGYLVQHSDRLYGVGPTVMRLAQVMMQRDTQHELIRVVMPQLERCRDLTGESAALHCPAGTQYMCVAEVPSRQMLRVSSGLGSRFPLHVGAPGMVIMAWSSPTTSSTR